MIKSYDLCKMEIVGMKMILSVLTFAVVFLIVSCDITERTVSLKEWPNCNEYKEACDKAKANFSNVVYAKAHAANDSLLYAFSTISIPTIVVARVTGGDIDMHFNWTKLVDGDSLEDAITINETFAKVEYKYGVAFTRLFEYFDTENSADITDPAYGYPKNNGTDWIIRDFTMFKWTLDTNNTAKNAFIFNATYENNDFNPPDLPENKSLFGNWSISFMFTVRGDSGRASTMPSMKYEANETQFDFIMSNFTPTFNKSRFAVESVLVSQSKNKNMQINTVDSIDDEYSPGVFQIVNWLSYPEQELSNAYFQWKPVCYLSASRGRSVATQVKHYGLTDMRNVENMTLLLKQSILFGLFGEDLYNEKVVLAQATNISFGLTDDGYYVGTNYTVWSAALGYGTPPTDTISLTVIIIISAGLGVPVLVLIFGGIYTCIKKSKARKRSQYENIDSNTKK